jgi:hypothetical protein
LEIFLPFVNIVANVFYKVVLPFYMQHLGIFKIQNTKIDLVKYRKIFCGKKNLRLFVKTGENASRLRAKRHEKLYIPTEESLKSIPINLTVQIQCLKFIIRFNKIT